MNSNSNHKLIVAVKQGEEINLGFTIKQNNNPYAFVDTSILFQVKRGFLEIKSVDYSTPLHDWLEQYSLPSESLRIMLPHALQILSVGMSTNVALQRGNLSHA